MESTGTYKYNSRSSTKRFNHVTTVKNAPNMFKWTQQKKQKHIGTDYFAIIDPKKETTAVESIANHINCKNTGGNLDTETYSIWMHRYGPSQCATSLVAYPRFGGNMQVLTQ